MRTALAALALCAALGACDPAADYNTIPAAKDAVRGHLRDPDSAEFSDVTAFPQADHPGKSIVCGYVNSHNGFGGMAGRERFMAAGTMVVLEEQSGAELMDGVWTRFCH